ncbi:MAG: DUF3352 domain-containing protein [Actinomycetota bacterium]|nr:DUF3352 domain-containing protein [Actinomycetota bacterium]
MKRRLTILTAAGAALIGLAAGCGGGSDDEDSGPATLVPADAPAYFEVVIRPEGEAAESADAALGKIIDSDDPGQEIITQIEAAAQEDGEDFDYERDIEPWLGERAGVYPSSLAGESEAVLVVETTDADEALEYLSSQDDATGEKQDYGNAEYELDDDGDAFGIVDDFLVFGSEEGFKKTVDTADGDDTLAGSDEFNDSVGDLPAERLATLYAVPKTFIEAIPEEEIDPKGREIILKALDEAGEDPILGDLTATDTALSFELSSGGGGDVSTEESALVSELPANAWLGIGLADIGAAFQNGLTSLESAGIPGLDAAAIREQLRARSGIDLEQDVIDTLGDAALFVQGTTADDVGGALVIESKDPAASVQLLTKVQGLIAQQGDPKEIKVQPLASATGDQGFQLTDPSGGLPQPIQVVQRGDRIVVGYGAASVQQGLTAQSGAQGLSGSPAFTGAQEAIGDLGIDAFLSFAPVFQLAESSGSASDPDFQRAKPYLDSLDFLALGSGSEDDRAIVRFILGLK